MAEQHETIKQILAICEDYKKDYDRRGLIPEEFRKIRRCFHTLNFYLSGQNPELKDVPPEIIISVFRDGFQFDPTWTWKSWPKATPEEIRKNQQRDADFKRLYASLNW